MDILVNPQVDLRHKDEDRDLIKVNKNDEVGPPPVIDVGIDLSEFYMSVEWDILEVGSLYLRYHVVPLNMKMHNSVFRIGADSVPNS